LNIIVRRKWIRSHLGCYLRLVEDNRCGVPENCPLPCHSTTREEELFEIGVLSFERLVTLHRQGVAGRLDDVVLVEAESVGARVSTPHA
jgi:hypothetical protein